MPLRFRPLGGSGTLVSEFCLGTMTFGTETDEPEAHRILDEFVEAGGNFVDTADPYSDGVSEEIIGSWLARRGRSDDLVIATKVFFPMGDDPNEQGLSARWIKQEVENSLRRLRLDHVDLYQAHCWDPLTPLEETLAGFDDLVRAGKVRYIGVSNFMGWQLQRAALLTRMHGWARIITLQPQYNLLAREIVAAEATGAELGDPRRAERPAAQREPRRARVGALRRGGSGPRRGQRPGLAVPEGVHRRRVRAPPGRAQRLSSAGAGAVFYFLPGRVPVVAVRGFPVERLCRRSQRSGQSYMPGQPRRSSATFHCD